MHASSGWIDCCEQRLLWMAVWWSMYRSLGVSLLGLLELWFLLVNVEEVIEILRSYGSVWL